MGLDAYLHDHGSTMRSMPATPKGSPSCSSPSVSHSPNVSFTKEKVHAAASVAINVELRWDRVEFASHVTRCDALENWRPPGWSHLVPDTTNMERKYEQPLLHIKEKTDGQYIQGVWFALSLCDGKRPSKSCYPILPAGCPVGQYYHRINIPLSHLYFTHHQENAIYRIPLHHEDVLLYKVGMSTGDIRVHVQLLAVLLGSEEHSQIERLLEPPPRLFRGVSYAASVTFGQLEGPLNKATNAYLRWDTYDACWRVPHVARRRGANDQERHVYVQLFFPRWVEISPDAEWDVVIKGSPRDV